jgi:hypothetical protein
MASPQPVSGSISSQLLTGSTPRAIRDALVGAERDEFERRYGEEMTAAARSLDLTRVLAVLGSYRRIAELTQRQGAATHERMLTTAGDLLAGRDVPLVSEAQARAQLAARLGS